MTDPSGTPLTSKETALPIRQDITMQSLIDIEIAIDDDGLGSGSNVELLIERAVSAALRAGIEGDIPATEIFVRIVGAAESQALNHQYRGKDKATNVLSFPGVEPEEMDMFLRLARGDGPPLMLGDIVIAAPVVIEEAVIQGKAIEDHLAHLIVHGVLHLLGHDHIEDEQADMMEDLERTILTKLDVGDPYMDMPSHD